MIRHPPRSTLDRSSAASDVYKRQGQGQSQRATFVRDGELPSRNRLICVARAKHGEVAVSYTHLRAHETVLDLVCRLLLEKKKNE